MNILENNYFISNGKQSTVHQGILPAFGSFTGLAKVSPKKDERIFVIADDKIIAYSNV